MRDLGALAGVALGMWMPHVIFIAVPTAYIFSALVLATTRPGRIAVQH